MGPRPRTLVVKRPAIVAVRVGVVGAGPGIRGMLAGRVAVQLAGCGAVIAGLVPLLHRDWQVGQPDHADGEVDIPRRWGGPVMVPVYLGGRDVEAVGRAVHGVVWARAGGGGRGRGGAALD